MNIFLDTSSLFKLYHREDETEELMQLMEHSDVEQIFLSSVSLVEFYSTVWKKFRVKEIDEPKAAGIIKMFEENFTIYEWIEDSDSLKSFAVNLLSRYGKTYSISTLDSIQLATAVSLKPSVSLFKTSDKILQQLFEAEGLPTK